MRKLGEVVCGKAPDREQPAEMTLFKSNGLAIENVGACKFLERAKAQGVGTRVPLLT